MKIVLVVFVLVIIISCDSNTRNSNIDDIGEVSKLAGYWQQFGQNEYLEITSSGEAYLRKCSIVNGFPRSEKYTGSISSGMITFPEGVQTIYGSITLVDDQLSIQADSADIRYRSVGSIPSSCEGDVIVITDMSPNESELGVENQFVVNFDYRLIVFSEAEVTLGYSNGKKLSQTIHSDVLRIDSEGIGSGSFTVNLIPVKYNGFNEFNIFINLNPINEEGGSFINIASDYKAVELVN